MTENPASGALRYGADSCYDIRGRRGAVRRFAPVGEEHMLQFNSITLESAEQLKPLLNRQSYRTCDYTVGATFQWRAYFDSCYALTSGMAVLAASYPSEGRCYMLPVGGGDMQAALSAVERDAEERGIPLKFCAVPEEGVEILRARYGERAAAQPHRDWADYLYTLSSLQTFAGKKLHGQKNHLNRFLRENPDYRYVEVTPETMDRAAAFLKEYAEEKAASETGIELEEMQRSEELLARSADLGLTAGYIETANGIVALSVGEVVGDTLYVHVEKAKASCPGAYQAIVSEFAKNAAQADTLYCNREDDSGEEGLRTSKLAYQPIRLVDKYWVTVTRE
jgi:hypothetical protein